MDKILIVDDRESYASMLSEALQLKGYATVLASDGPRALEAARAENVDLVISDYVMTPWNGLDVLREIKKLDETLPVILITDKQHFPEIVREAEREGCLDFISKGGGDNQKLVDFDLLHSKINKALTMRRLLRENLRLRKKFRLDNVVGGSRPMEEIFALIQKVAPTDCTVLIQGESGTGKELVARALHQLSPRHANPLVPINCGGMPEPLLESELFGHKRGAFTSAFSDKRGLFEEAEGGTLFLDEISMLPMNLQAKLLRAIQEREIRRVGDNATIRVNVRIIAATNQSLADMLRSGTFREDLYYRLSVIPIEVPPLRARMEDVPLLVSHFLETSQLRKNGSEIGISHEALDLLCAYAWPGNVRELQNTIDRAIVLCEGRQIRPKDLPQQLQDGDIPVASGIVRAEKEGLLPSLDEVVSHLEKEYCTRVVQQHNGDKKKAAEALKISLAALYRKLGPSPRPSNGSSGKNVGEDPLSSK